MTVARDLLPANVVPRHYHVTLETNFDKFTFDGTVVIDLDVEEDSNSIKLHTLELDLHKTTVSCDGAEVRYGNPRSFNDDVEISCLTKSITQHQSRNILR